LVGIAYDICGALLLEVYWYRFLAYTDIQYGWQQKKPITDIQTRYYVVKCQ